MVEVKLIGQIPVKQNSANSDKFVVNGASIYEAQNGDKYVFLSLKNPQKSPIFGFSLNIRQYDAAGAFIKESRYFDTQTYCGREQTYVLENPISVEKECEALEIAVVSVITFEGKIHKSEISIPTSEEMKLAKINTSIIKEEKKVEAKEEVTSKEENVVTIEGNINVFGGVHAKYKEISKYCNSDVSLMFYIKKCVEYWLYNNHDELFIDFDNSEPGKALEIDFIPNWITQENTNALYRRKGEYYNPFHIVLLKKRFRHDTSTTILEVDKMQNTWKRVIKKRDIPNKRWIRF